MKNWLVSLMILVESRLKPVTIDIVPLLSTRGYVLAFFVCLPSLVNEIKIASLELFFMFHDN